MEKFRHILTLVDFNADVQYLVLIDLDFNGLFISM